jgi:nucleotide-binding universal stress UspA family protein
MQFARIFGGRISLLQVLDPAPYRETPNVVEPLSWQIRKAEADVYLKGLTTQLRNRGFDSDYTLREGRTPENIVDFAHEQDVDLLILSTHGASGLSRWNISGVVTKVIEKIYLPVLLLRAYQDTIPGVPITGGEDAQTMGSYSTSSGQPDTASPQPRVPTEVFDQPVSYRRILVPIDTSRRAECSLPAAITLAKTIAAQPDGAQPDGAQGRGPESRGAESDGTHPTNPPESPTLVLAAVVDPIELPIPGPYPDEIEQMRERFLSLSHRAVEGYLNDLKMRVQVNCETRIVDSPSVSVAIHHLVEQEAIDLVVLCAHGQTGEINWPYGSTARNYIEYGTRPVLVIQDVPLSQVRPTAAEVAAEKYGRR